MAQLSVIGTVYQRLQSQTLKPLKRSLKVFLDKQLICPFFRATLMPEVASREKFYPFLPQKSPRLVDDAFPTYGDEAKNGEKFRRFIAGLDPYLQLRCHEQGVKTLEEALQFAMQIEAAHLASKMFVAPGQTQFFSTIPVYPMSSVAPTLQDAPTPLGVNSANADEMKKILKTIETLSDKVERLQLAVDCQGHQKQDAGFRRRSYTPEGRRGDRNADDYYGSSPRRRDSYDRNRSSRRTPRQEEEEYRHHNDQRTQSGSSECFAHGYDTSHRNNTNSGRSPDTYQ